MIIFEKLWKTMKKKGISQYKLTKEYKVSSGQLDRLRKNGNINSYTINQLCDILNCKVEDIMEYKKDSSPRKINTANNNGNSSQK